MGDFRPKTTILSQYNLFRQTAGSERWGGVTLRLRPSESAENHIRIFVDDKDLMWAVQGARWGTEKGLAEHGISHAEVHIVALADPHPVDSSELAYGHAAQKALENAVQFAAADADTGVLSIIETYKSPSFRQHGIVVAIDAGPQSFINNADIAESEAPFRLALEKMMAEESAENFPNHAISLRHIIFKGARWNAPLQRFLPYSPSDSDQLPFLVTGYRNDFRAALQNAHKFA